MSVCFAFECNHNSLRQSCRFFDSKNAEKHDYGSQLQEKFSTPVTPQQQGNSMLMSTTMVFVTLASHDGQQCCELTVDRHVWTLT